MPTLAACRRHAAADPWPTPAPSRHYVLAVDLGTGGPKVAVDLGHGAHRGPRVRAGRRRSGRRRRRRAAPRGLVGCHRRRRPAGPSPRAASVPRAIVGVGCTAQWSGTVAVGADGAAIGPAIIWMDSRGANAVQARGARVRSTCRATRRRKADPVGPAHRRHPEPLGQGPGGAHPLPARRASRGLRGHRRLPRAGGLPQSAPDRVWPGPPTTPSRCTGSPTTATSTPSPTTTACSAWPGSSAARLPELVPTGQHPRGLSDRRGGRARPPGRARRS